MIRQKFPRRSTTSVLIVGSIVSAGSVPLDALHAMSSRGWREREIAGCCSIRAATGNDVANPPTRLRNINCTPGDEMDVTVKDRQTRGTARVHTYIKHPAAVGS
jgi:hypothetical protein